MLGFSYSKRTLSISYLVVQQLTKRAPTAANHRTKRPNWAIKRRSKRLLVVVCGCDASAEDGGAPAGGVGWSGEDSGDGGCGGGGSGVMWWCSCGDDGGVRMRRYVDKYKLIEVYINHAYSVPDTYRILPHKVMLEEIVKLLLKGPSLNADVKVPSLNADVEFSFEEAANEVESVSDSEESNDSQDNDFLVDEENLINEVDVDMQEFYQNIDKDVEWPNASELSSPSKSNLKQVNGKWVKAKRDETSGCGGGINKVSGVRNSVFSEVTIIIDITSLSNS
ncbi:hypothetical protein Tco_0622598 [Tanacetum coccineum]